MAARNRRTLDVSAVSYGPDGLVATVVQDADDGRVLMVAWQDAEALEATLATGEAHFHSRSRDALWKKGETSGNTLAVVSMELDCDADAVLITARPAGPTCHTGARSCFDLEPGVEAAPGGVGETQDFAWLERLWAVIEERARTRPEGSYTSRLLEAGVDATARKVAEEATEVVMAAKDDDVAERSGNARPTGELAGELADLLYHSLVLCAERGLPPATIIETLKARHEA
ncbi:MAG: bifunctional phosphoribosyl-AMP cyclohydrolase/phosphoribosyl-ATP diphosphatase HisIE [Candidatus Limnocylindrales bacterium]